MTVIQFPSSKGSSYRDVLESVQEHIRRSGLRTLEQVITYLNKNFLQKIIDSNINTMLLCEDIEDANDISRVEYVFDSQVKSVWVFNPNVKYCN